MPGVFSFIFGARGMRSNCAAALGILPCKRFAGREVRRDCGYGKCFRLLFLLTKTNWGHTL